MPRSTMSLPGTPLTGYDCVIIPGTKNTIDDLQALRAAGTDRELPQGPGTGVPVIGICGGYQMLGKTLIDAGFESAAGPTRARASRLRHAFHLV